MTTQVIVNGSHKFITGEVADFKTVAFMANLHFGFINRMKYSHEDGRSGSMGPADRLRVSTGTRFIVT